MENPVDFGMATHTRFFLFKEMDLLYNFLGFWEWYQQRNGRDWHRRQYIFGRSTKYTSGSNITREKRAKIWGNIGEQRWMVCLDQFLDN